MLNILLGHVHVETFEVVSFTFCVHYANSETILIINIVLAILI